MRNERSSRLAASVAAAAFTLAPGAFVPAANAKDAAAIVDRMVAAHGGLDAWRNAPSVSFTDSWTAPGSPGAQVSNVIVEQGRRRSLIEYPSLGAQIGWDGQRAWSVGWEMPMPPRFLVGLTYYFSNLAWLVKDPGVVLHEPETITLWDDATEYIAIRVTYEAGVGDTPDDYYVLYIHPGTYELHGCEYVVSYPGLVPPGMKHTPPHFLIYHGLTIVDGLKVPTGFTIYLEDHSEYGACKLTDWSFSRPFDAESVAMPDGAVEDTSMSK